MKIAVVTMLEVPDPTPAPNAPGSPESPLELPDVNKVAQAVDKAMQSLPAAMADLGLGFHNATVVAAIPDQVGKTLVETWNALIPLYMGLLIKQVPTMPGLLAVPVFPEPADQAAAQVVSMRGPQSARDLIGYRVDLLSAMTHGTHIVAKQTEQALAPLLDIARQMQRARDAVGSAVPDGPREPEITGVG